MQTVPNPCDVGKIFWGITTLRTATGKRIEIGGIITVRPTHYLMQTEVAYNNRLPGGFRVGVDETVLLGFIAEPCGCTDMSGCQRCYDEAMAYHYYQEVA